MHQSMRCAGSMRKMWTTVGTVVNHSLSHAARSDILFYDFHDPTLLTLVIQKCMFYMFKNNNFFWQANLTYYVAVQIKLLELVFEHVMRIVVCVIKHRSAAFSSS